jgi:predicted permease
MTGWLRELGRRLYYLLNRARLERELREEMQAHRAMKGGSGPRFGNELRLREEAADQWGWTWLERLQQDVRFGARLLHRSPAFTLTAVAVLALGIGVNLAAFEVFDAVALSWLPVRAPESLVNLSSRTPQGHSTSFSYPEYQYYRSRASSLSGTFALVYGSVDLNGVPATNAEFVNAAYLTDLATRPVAGRLFDPGDERPGATPVLLLDEGIWRTRFGADASIVGRTVKLNGHPFEVAGVVTSSFTAFHGRVAVWIPVTQHPAAFTGSTLLDDWSSKGSVRFYGRLRPGVSIGAAQSELASLAAALHRERPADTPEGEWIELRAAGKYLPLGEANPVVLALVAALVMLVLVTACMNLGVLVLARTLGRDREFAVRLSVGASRGRLLRQLMTEHSMLGLFGAATGCAVAAAATRAFALATGLPDGIAPHLTWRSTAVAAALAIVSALVFGLTPALQAVRPPVSRRLRLRSVLLTVQVTAAGVLLIVSGLLVRGVTTVVRVPLGFDYQHTLLADPDLSAHGMKPDVASAYWRRVDTRVRHVPGVVDAAVTSLPPFGNRIAINRERTVFYSVTPSYFSTLRIPIVRGRIFGDEEKGVVVISQSLARRRWPSGDAVGQKYYDALVIGVVGGARTVRIGEAASGECYRALDSADPLGPPMAAMVVRTSGPPQNAAATVAAIERGEAAALTPTVRPLAEVLEEKLDEPRQVALIASSLGMTALLLAVTGLGGLIAYTVSQRTREIGVRVALGARPAHVVAAIARQFRTPILCGALGGSVLAAGAGTILSSELFGVSQFDPLAHGGALLLFAVVAACAAAPSLRRALRVDPAITLRAE